MNKLKKHVNNAIFKAQQSGKSKQLAESIAIKEYFLNEIPQVESFFKFIKEKSVEKEVQIKFILGEGKYIAITKEIPPNEIQIKINPKSDKDKLVSAFVHELGEAGYILRNFPLVRIEDSLYNYGGRITELFSHLYIKEIVKQYNLEEIERGNGDEEIKRWRKKNYLECYKYKWEQVLMVSWAIINYSRLKEEKSKLLGYKQNSEYIENIINVLNNISYDQDEIKKLVVEIIDLLKELSFPHEIKIYSMFDG
ncbi:hypothetical protein U472_11505 [Orenia metallireducens]|uniref:Uncharacterized protein n=1 Tax=Orenia metallireducens TaxID=1413210 RepID=A0A1C0A8K6_9FIRM|nr:hypothetical protein [Orenia metallireducens]OCL26603.1 hypothetical protein U472_11505 [Orenia metallireducens]